MKKNDQVLKDGSDSTNRVKKMYNTLKFIQLRENLVVLFLTYTPCTPKLYSYFQAVLFNTV